MEDVSKTMYALAERLKELRDEKKEAESRTKTVTMKIADIEQQLAGLMVQMETQNFTRAGTMYALVNKTRASAAAERKSELYDALKRNGHEDMVYETVNANTLSSFVKEQIEENDDILPPWLDGLVNVYEQTTVSVRKSARKSN